MRLIGFDKKVIVIINDTVDNYYSVNDDYEENSYTVRVKLKNSELFDIKSINGDSYFFSITELIYCTDLDDNKRIISLWKNNDMIFRRKLEENEILILECVLENDKFSFSKNTLYIQLKICYGKDSLF